MGSCISLYKDTGPISEFRMSVHRNNTKKLITSKTNMIAGDVQPRKSSGFRGREGCKDEVFFDSQPWLDSDFEDEDDYFTVTGGGVSPSFSTTPLNNFDSTTQEVNEESSMRHDIDTSPTRNKKKLRELFLESLNHDEHQLEVEVARKSTTKSWKSKQCCIPKLIPLQVRKRRACISRSS